MPRTKKPKNRPVAQVFKTVEEMTGPEVVQEARHLADYAEACRQIQQGINTKEVVRFNKCVERIENEKLTSPDGIVSIRLQWDPRMSQYRSMLVRLYENGGTLEGMRALFAPA